MLPFMLTYEEALKYENSIPVYEAYDMETGYLREEYLEVKRNMPKPPPGTTVYEVGTGRPYSYTPGCTFTIKIHKESALYAQAKRDLEKAKRSLQQSTSREPEERDAGTSTPSGGLKRAIPVPSSCATSGTTQHHRGQEEAGNTDNRDRILLVTVTEGVVTNVCRPFLVNTLDSGLAFGEEVQLLNESPTLRLLRNGYRNYLQSGLTEQSHLLTAYTCRSSRLKLFRVYKSITCKGRPSPLKTIDDPNDQNLYRSLAIINQYLNVFSVLADFHYTLVAPSLKHGLCNVLVMDKRWVFSDVRKIYYPTYQLLTNDKYTDLLTSEIRKIKTNTGARITKVRFLSTPNTILFTCQRALIMQNEGTTEITTAPRAQEGFVRPITPPPKKRRTLFYQDKPSTSSASTSSSSSSTPFVDRPTPSTSSAPADKYKTYEQDIKRQSESTSTEFTQSGVLNPTLVVFKHNLTEEDPDTLLCNIVLEVNLSGSVHY